MSLYKQNGSKYWWCVFYADGKRVRLSTKQTDRELAAGVEVALRMASRGGDKKRVLGMIDALMGEDGAEEDRTKLEDVWGEYISAYNASGRTVTGQTLSARRGSLRRFIVWRDAAAPGVRSIEDVTRRVAGSYAAWLATQPIAQKTRRDNILELSGIWRALMRFREALTNPWSYVIPARGESVRTDAFTTDEERRVMAAARREGHGWWLACMVARHTGLRYRDVALLRWSEVDLGRGVIALRPRKTRRHNISVTVPIARPLRTALERARTEARSEWVIPEQATIARSHKTSASRFSGLLLRAGITDGRHTFHSWRHTFRSRLGAAGVGTETAMRLCGHTTREMSAWYDHADHIEEMREAVEAAAGGQKDAGSAVSGQPARPGRAEEAG